MTYFTIWHYLAIALSALLFIGGVFLSSKQKKSTFIPLVVSFLFLSILLSLLSIILLDRYTKHAQVISLQNHRVLSREQIVYTGIVKNIGNYEIGRVKLTIRLINGTATQLDTKHVVFYKQNSFLSFFHPKQDRPGFTSHTFTVAKNLKPGAIKKFQVSFPFPPYFSRTSQFIDLTAH